MSDYAAVADLMQRTPLQALESYHQSAVRQALEDFVAGNEDPRASPNFRDPNADNLNPLTQARRIDSVLDALPSTSSSSSCSSCEPLLLLLLKALKILSRKHTNRIALGVNHGLRAVLKHVKQPASIRWGCDVDTTTSTTTTTTDLHLHRVAAEGANVVLNACYEKPNVERVVAAGGVAALVAFLADDIDKLISAGAGAGVGVVGGKVGDGALSELRANAAGALQSICFQEEGRTQVRTRAVGAIHNLSSDAGSIRVIRRAGESGIPVLVSLLSDTAHPAVQAAAAGALQNVSREVASRMIIRELYAVPPLAELLVGTDMQVCAAGALLNILGPELSQGKDTERRKAFGKIISLCLISSSVSDALFSTAPETP
eukprot:jgi/Chlat1/6848/Chrsp51S06566